MHYKSLDSALLAYNSMNGRYFAGKQITCEFVAVTKWKAAICGEYMRSRFKTCSRGVACNFIHCFRNPGGDYEWADWENPPPKFWTRKMAALFGPSDDTVFDKANDTPDFELSRSSDRKRLRSSDDSRYDSSRYRDGDAHKRHSSRDYSHPKHERSSPKHGHGRHRREPSAANKQRGQDIEDNTGRYCSAMENERVSKKHISEERKNDHGDGGRGDNDEIKYKKHRSEWRESVEPGCSDWLSECTDAGTSKSPSGSKSTVLYNSHKRSWRQSSDDPNLEGHYSTAHRSAGKGHSTKRSSRRSTEDDSYDEKDSGRRKSRKHSDHFDDPEDRWLATNSDVDSDAETQSLRSSSRVGKLGRKDNAHPDEEDRHQRSSSRPTNWSMKDDKSSRKRKHHSKTRKGSDSGDDRSDSKDTKDLGSHAQSSRSRSSEEDVSLHRSRKKSQ